MLTSLTSTLHVLFPHPEIQHSPQLEEELQDDLKWSIEVKEILHSGKSDFQSVELVNSGPFGKVRKKREREREKEVLLF